MAQKSIGRGDLVRQAITTLLRYPSVGLDAGDTSWLATISGDAYRILATLLDEIASNPNITTAGLIERHRDRYEASGLMKLAATETLVDEQQAAEEFRDLLTRLEDMVQARRLEDLLELARTGELDGDQKTELKKLLDALGTSSRKASEAVS